MHTVSKACIPFLFLSLYERLFQAVKAFAIYTHHITL
jgi:hypothetical protein